MCTRRVGDNLKSRCWIYCAVLMDAPLDLDSREHCRRVRLCLWGPFPCQNEVAPIDLLLTSLGLVLAVSEHAKPELAAAFCFDVCGKGSGYPVLHYQHEMDIFELY